MVDRVLPRPPHAAGMCINSGHHYGGPGGWRACACDRRIPGHAATPPDPAGGPGCGMVWRVCVDCPHVDEHHLTDHDPTDHQPARHELADHELAEQGRGGVPLVWHRGDGAAPLGDHDVVRSA